MVVMARLGLSAIALLAFCLRANAQEVPNYDVHSACTARSISDDPSVIKMCENNENTAFNVVELDWARASASQKADCQGQVKDGRLPYSTLAICLESKLNPGG
jgi:hypothetical protein